jgi:predicted NAD-dependent protein-ADP-ribosyltransferase YbiA (DUF1768 family)
MSCSKRFSFSDICVETPDPVDILLITDKYGNALYLGCFHISNVFSNHYRTNHSFKLSIDVNGEIVNIEGDFTKKLLTLLKAHYFNAPNELIVQIENSNNRQKVQELDGTIPNFDEKKWKEVSPKFMLECTRAKFKYNPELSKMLLETGDAYIALINEKDFEHRIDMYAEDVAYIIQEAIKKGVEFDGTIEDYVKTVIKKYEDNDVGECVMRVRGEMAQAA